MNSRTKTTPRPAASINAHEVYSIGEFCRRVGIAAPALRALKRAGLRTVKAGKRVFVLGEDWIRFLREREQEA